MYKCTDCQQLYNEKPNYCDCGNNTFEEITQQTTTQKQRQSSVAYFSQIKKFFETFDLLSLAIFSTCIILSILIQLFIQPNPSITPTTPEKEKNLIVKTIPSIDKLWINEVIETKKDSTKAQQKTKTPVLQQIVKQKPQNTTPKTEKIKDIKKEPQTNPPPAKNEKNTTEEIIKKQELEQIKAQEIKQQQKENEEQWNNYKVALRQALFNNLSVTSVIGSGECIIEFAIQKDGKIINRGFLLQSPNETVNQAVYTMMMKLPYYYSPPAMYKGEKIKMKFLFKNGSFEISYIN